LRNNWQPLSEMYKAMSQQDSNEQLSRSDRIASSTRASDRASAQRKKSRRMLRTIFLGTVAMIGGVFWLGDQYGVDRADTWNLLVTSAGFVALLALGRPRRRSVYLANPAVVQQKQVEINAAVCPPANLAASSIAEHSERIKRGLPDPRRCVWEQSQICENHHCCPDCLRAPNSDLSGTTTS
jgi:hypothetical protein